MRIRRQAQSVKLEFHIALPCLVLFQAYIMPDDTLSHYFCPMYRSITFLLLFLVNWGLAQQSVTISSTCWTEDNEETLLGASQF